MVFCKPSKSVRSRGPCEFSRDAGRFMPGMKGRSLDPAAALPSATGIVSEISDVAPSGELMLARIGSGGVGVVVVGGCVGCASASPSASPATFAP